MKSIELGNSLIVKVGKNDLEKIPKSFKYRFKLHPEIDKIAREGLVYQ